MTANISHPASGEAAKSADANGDAATGNTQPAGKLDAADSQTGANIAAGFRVAGAVAGQATLVTALLYYFGWVRTQAVLDYFGVNAAIAGLSVNDYILRSLNVAVRMLVLLGLLTLVMVLGHRWLSSIIASGKHPSVGRVAALACLVAGVALCVAGMLGFYNLVVYSTQYPYVPVMLAVGITLIGYGINLRGSARADPQSRNWSARAQAATIVVLDIVCVFWAVAVYANIVGEQAAQVLAASLPVQPSVTIYSEKPLGLDSLAQVQQLPASSSQYRYRYTNLKLLLYSAGRYFLVPENWKRGRDPVYLISEGSGIRFEFYAGS